MKIRTETKHVIELDDQEVNELFDQLVGLLGEYGHSTPILVKLRDVLLPIRRGH